MVVLLEGEPHEVVRITDCRASLVPVRRVEVEFKTLSEKSVRFSRAGISKSVSPNSEMELA